MGPQNLWLTLHWILSLIHSNEVQMELRLVCFQIRGRCESIRLLLVDNDLAFDEIKATPLNTVLTHWTLHAPFPMVPALEFKEGNMNWFWVMQSSAILRYLGRKLDLYGSTDEAKGRIDELNDNVEDLRKMYTNLIYRNYENGKAEYIEKLPDFLLKFERVLNRTDAGNTGAAVDGKMSFVDYNLFDLLDIHLLLDPSCLDPRPTLKAYYDKFLARPGIYAYRESGLFKRRHVNGNGKQ